MHVKCQNIITVNPLLSPLGGGGGAFFFQAQIMGGLKGGREGGGGGGLFISSPINGGLNRGKRERQRGGGGGIIHLEKTMVSAVHKELDWRLCSQGSESSPNFSFISEE